MLSTIRLTCDQLWAIIEGTASLTDVNHCIFINFRAENPREPHNEVGTISPAEHLVGFEPVPFQFIPNVLAHKAALPNLNNHIE